MSDLHRRAMEAVLDAARQDILDTLEEQGIRDQHSEEADEAVFDVAILHAYRIFTRICESRGVTVDAGLFSDLASELAQDIAEEDAAG